MTIHIHTGWQSTWSPKGVGTNIAVLLGVASTVAATALVVIEFGDDSDQLPPATTVTDVPTWEERVQQAIDAALVQPRATAAPANTSPQPDQQAVNDAERDLEAPPPTWQVGAKY